MSKVNGSITNMDLGRTDFSLLRDTLGNSSEEQRGLRELIDIQGLLKAQESPILMCRKSRNHGRKPVLMNGNSQLSSSSKKKKKACRKRKQGSASGEQQVHAGRELRKMKFS